MTHTIRSSTTLDLEGVDESRRAEIWQAAARRMFPGVTVHATREGLPIGSISGSDFGPGQLWRILSPPVRVDYDPVDTESALADSFSVMLQLQGSTLATQGVEEEKEQPEKLMPAVPVKKSVMPEYIICLEDGKKLKMLKRHLKTRYNMSPEEYRKRWGLADDYPMVAPNYAEQRSSLAKKIGLGTKPRARGRRSVA